MVMRDNKIEVRPIPESWHESDYFFVSEVMEVSWIYEAVL